MESDKAFPERETNPADSVKLEGYNPKLAETSCAELAGPDQIHPGCHGDWGAQS